MTEINCLGLQFVLATLFAGVINTGINACWVLLFLAGNPTWRTKATNEIHAFISKHSPSPSSSPSPSPSPTDTSLATRLSQISPNAWEDDTPTMDLIIRETIRLIVAGSALRRNVKDDLFLDGKKIEKGAFMAMPLSSVHLNPEIYEKPEEFDPGRFEAGREEDKTTTFGYLGWGVGMSLQSYLFSSFPNQIDVLISVVGRHPCLGMRFAKLELKIILALFLTTFEYSHVDAQGRPARVSASDVDRNDIFQSRPVGEPPFLRYRRVQQ